jgi:D-inositol-3-phosphate glycosyltransferase
MKADVRGVGQLGGAGLMQRQYSHVARGDNVVRVGRRTRTLNRIAMLSVHTSPLETPGAGDAGGMNVYVVELSRRLAALGNKIEIFTRATSRSQASVTEMEPGILVRHVIAGPFEGLTKTDLPGQLCTFAREVLRIEAAYQPGYYDLIHAHYWLSGQVGALARDRWGVPLVHSMHTMAKVKNDLLAEGDDAEPVSRVIGEQQVVDAADLIIANTSAEGQQLIDLYGAPSHRVRVINPGVDLSVFRPGDQSSARDRVGIARDALVMMFAGRLQPLKAPDVLIKVAAEMLVRRPELRSRLVVPIIGGPSGGGLGTSRALAELASRLGVEDVVRFVPPVGRTELADYFRAASVVCVPSYNESFGLVALEAQACGTPVVAANVGGLPTAIRDGITGFLVDGHRPADYAAVVGRLLGEPRLLARLGRASVEHAAAFGWDRTAVQTLQAYDEAHQLAAPKPMAAAQ